MKEKQIEIIYDHYKETNQLRLDAQKRRNRNFMLSCVCEAVSFLFLIRSDSAMSVFQSIVKTLYGIETLIENDIVQTFLWLLITIFLIKYMQETIYIERQYIYQGRIEKEIDALLSTDFMGREGQEYEKNYPKSLEIFNFFYTWICPILFIAINTYRIINECISFRIITLFDVFIYICVEVMIFVFLYDIHKVINK